MKDLDDFSFLGEDSELLEHTIAQDSSEESAFGSGFPEEEAPQEQPKHQNQAPRQTAQAPVVRQGQYPVKMSEADAALAATPGVVVGEIGTRVSRVPIERSKFTKQKKDRIAIISKKVIILKTHYSEEAGSFLCYGGSCCQYEELPRIRYCFPIIRYSTDKNGKIIDKDVVIELLVIGDERYEDILTINDVADITTQDLIVTCSDEQYQKITFTSAGPAAWRTDKGIIEYATKTWSQHKEKAYLCVAKTLTEQQYFKLKGIESGSSQIDNNLSFDDVFNS